MEFVIEYSDKHEYAKWTIEAESPDSAILKLCAMLNKNRLETEQVIPSDFKLI